MKLPYNDRLPLGVDSNRPWGTPNPKLITPQGEGYFKDQSDVIHPNEEPEPKQLKTNEKPQKP